MYNKISFINLNIRKNKMIIEFKKLKENNFSISMIMNKTKLSNKKLKNYKNFFFKILIKNQKFRNILIFSKNGTF